MRSAVRKGKPSKKPRLTARKRVWCGGENNTWCMNLTLFCKCGMVWTLDAKWGALDGVGSGFLVSMVGVVVDSDKHQSVVDGSRLPWRTMVGPSRTRHELASKVTV